MSTLLNSLVEQLQTRAEELDGELARAEAQLREQHHDKYQERAEIHDAIQRLSPSRKPRRRSLRADTLAVLDTHNGPLTVRQVSELTGAALEPTRKMLLTLARDGKLTVTPLKAVGQPNGYTLNR